MMIVVYLFLSLDGTGRPASRDLGVNTWAGGFGGFSPPCQRCMDTGAAYQSVIIMGLRECRCRAAFIHVYVYGRSREEQKEMNGSERLKTYGICRHIYMYIPPHQDTKANVLSRGRNMWMDLWIDSPARGREVHVYSERPRCCDVHGSAGN
ncbi:hypothetical protein GGS23DRAFT_585578 [Durotheca rogersii]|uniref:uncharacterized protein n=1 Tax=Durotheca rogersii TaxID=419775 RepID=UPI00221E74FE|nr:uncharacterized protein GGS23DRAFT_585578 [Durotheca rogersii]KAI5859475.1 hypothetical protein GGS23DRAFT_585578 [Durotheca rogersii]